MRSDAAGETVVRVRIVGDGEPKQFEVIVQDGNGEMQYQVTMQGGDFERLSADGATPEECIRAAFRFLLEREQKESILRRFDISVIERYFPEFRREFPNYRDR